MRMLTCDKYSFRDTAAELVSASPAQPSPAQPVSLWRYLTPASWKMLLNVYSPQTATEMVRQHLRSVDLGANNRPPYNVLNVQIYLCRKLLFITTDLKLQESVQDLCYQAFQQVYKTILLKVCVDKCSNVCWRQFCMWPAPMSTELSDAAGHPTFCTALHNKGHSHSAEETCEGMWNKDEGGFLQTIILQIFHLKSTNLQYNIEVKYTRQGVQKVQMERKRVQKLDRRVQHNSSVQSWPGSCEYWSHKLN